VAQKNNNIIFSHNHSRRAIKSICASFKHASKFQKSFLLRHFAPARVSSLRDEATRGVGKINNSEKLKKASTVWRIQKFMYVEK
jgi:hypothetical protein